MKNINGSEITRTSKNSVSVRTLNGLEPIIQTVFLVYIEEDLAAEEYSYHEVWVVGASVYHILACSCSAVLTLGDFCAA